MAWEDKYLFIISILLSGLDISFRYLSKVYRQSIPDFFYFSVRASEPRVGFFTSEYSNSTYLKSPKLFLIMNTFSEKLDSLKILIRIYTDLFGPCIYYET